MLRMLTWPVLTVRGVLVLKPSAQFRSQLVLLLALLLRLRESYVTCCRDPLLRLVWSSSGVSFHADRVCWLQLSVARVPAALDTFGH